MERLTMRNSDGSYSQPTHTTFEAMFYRLAEFEDFMEEQGFEDLQDLEKYIALTIEASKIVAKKRQEIRTLKGNWAKLREFAEQLKGTSLHMTAHHEVQKDDKKFGEFFGRFENAKEVLIKMQELESADGEL